MKGLFKKIGKGAKNIGQGAMKAVSAIVPGGGGVPEESYASEVSSPIPSSTFPWIYVIGGIGILVVGAIIYRSRQA